MSNLQNNEIACSNNSIINISQNLIIDSEYNFDKFKNYISQNISIIYIGYNIKIDKRILNMHNNKKIDKLIILGSMNNKYISKRLFILSKINKSILAHVKKNLLIIIQLNNNYLQMKNVIKNLITLKKLSNMFNLNIGISFNNYMFLGFINKKNSIYFNDIVNSLKALYIDNIKNQYEYIYNTVCNYLDLKFQQNNFCEFKDNKCIANRLNISAHSNMGCCYSFKYAGFWDTRLIKDIKLCDHLNCKKCNAICIACKLFTCKYLRRKNIIFNSRNILLLDCFFNKKKNIILESNFFKTREEIIFKLLEKDNAPYFWYYLKRKYLI